MPIGGLNNTLQGLDVRGLQEAQARQELEALAQLSAQAAQAQQGAAQAQQAYQGAAAAPPPVLDPLAAFFPALFGNVASAVSGNLGYQKQAQEGIEGSQALLLKRRADNLQALRDDFLQQADQAKSLGDLEASSKFRTKSEQIARQHEQIMARQKIQADKEAEIQQHQNRLAEIREQGRQQRLTQAAKGGTDQEATDYLANIAESVESGQSELTNYPIKERGAIITFMKQKGMTITPKKAREAINEVSSAEEAVDEIERISAQVNTAREGFINRGIVGVRRLTESLNQTSLAADLETVRGGLAGNLARAVGAERGVLTDQDRSRAMALVPNLFTSQTKARRDIARLKRFLKSKRENAIKAFARPPGGVTPRNESGVDPKNRLGLDL